MLKYFKALWYAVTGRFSKAAAALQENQYVMTATYDAAIKKQEARFKTVKDAVAELVTIEDQRIREIKEIGGKVDKLNRVKTGAQAAMQDRINELRVGGSTKEQIEADAQFIKHRAAFADASSTLTEAVKRMEDKEIDLKERQKQLATYKTELQQMQRSSRSLTEEKQEALADVAIAQQQEAINATLAGIQTDSSDKDLQEARAARDRAKSRAKVTSELAGNDAMHAENEYLKFAEKAKNNTELDGLLNWGEETPDNKQPLAPAKLPN